MTWCLLFSNNWLEINREFISLFDPLTLPLLNVTLRRVGFGCEALGGYNWGNVEPERIFQAIDHALITCPDTQAVFFDTADTYGPHLSEKRLGEALQSNTDKAVIGSKFGVRLEGGKVWYDTSPDYVDRALDGSLTRLRRDCIDLYQLHWPDQVTPLHKTLHKLEQCREEGRIRSYGVCNVDLTLLLPLISDFPGLVTFSAPYSMIEKGDRTNILTACESGLIFLAYGCLGQGMLTGKYTKTAVFASNDRRSNPKYKNFHGPEFERNLKIVDRLRVVSKTLNTNMPAIALRFILTELPNSIALAGIKSVEQWHQNIAALAEILPLNSYQSLLDTYHETSL